LHPRNRHAARYEFPALTACCPELSRFVQLNPIGGETIDFADPAAVTALNQALLKHDYGLTYWEIPAGYLCPPVPGRADYIHQLADLLSAGRENQIPRGPQVAVLDIGIGANCVYPIIGVTEYGWRFVGTDIDPVAIASARRLVARNPTLAGRIECRLQRSATDIFKGIVKPGETFALSMCNPPFHASAEEAAAGTRRKLRNLHGAKVGAGRLNFGGQGNELWCAGGELGFVRRMIAQSVEGPQLCRWFTTLVSKRENLPAIYGALKAVKVSDVRTIDLAHGQKKSRIVAWTFRGRIGHARA
jgi:23S rRNA (adenine1618-N6)-methyltransferase